ncbi:uncharacterized protein LOC123408439 [Hordeum vulgare subsp. vulgare]|uniref:uncharacterized protein LOC123408439 n=1 Tax=Hordeum vulgare subsp. vulgare TaxID=112509 RepID=UPI001D1A4E7E|nr:uncharacterized protein LOC123408439 [Hordeum vulgare subsp. vulgare]
MCLRLTLPLPTTDELAGALLGQPSQVVVVPLPFLGSLSSHCVVCLVGCHHYKPRLDAHALLPIACPSNAWTSSRLGSPFTRQPPLRHRISLQSAGCKKQHRRRQARRRWPWCFPMKLLRRSPLASLRLYRASTATDQRRTTYSWPANRHLQHPAAYASSMAAHGTRSPTTVGLCRAPPPQLCRDPPLPDLVLYHSCQQQALFCLQFR